MIEYGLEWHALDSYFQFKEVSAPGTPESGGLRVYAKDKAGTSALYLKDDAGSEREIGPASAVTGTGTANRLAYWSSSSVLAANAALTQGHVLFADANGLPLGESNLFWDAANDRLGIGTASPVLGLDISGTTVNAGAVLFRAGGATGSTVLGRQSRGTVGSPTASQSGDVIFNFSSQAHDGSAFGTGALLSFVCSETWTGTAHGSHITLETTPTGSTTRAERWRITSAGVLRALAGGTVQGGASSGNDLTLSSTEHATKGHIIFGTTSSYDETNNVFGAQSLDPFAITARPGFLALSDSNAVLQLRSHGAGASLALFQSARGTIASPAALNALDDLFVFNAYGQYDTTVGHFNLGAQLSARATENYSSTAAGTRWQFGTVANTTTTLTERLRIDQDGAIHLLADAYHKYAERSTTPPNPTSGSECHVYMKADKFIVQYNRAGTVRYKYLDLDTAANQSWIDTTTAP